MNKKYISAIFAVRETVPDQFTVQYFIIANKENETILDVLPNFLSISEICSGKSL
jgi:hypothetical protein